MSPASNFASMAASPLGDITMNSLRSNIDVVRNWIAGEPQTAAGDEYFVKHAPSDGRALYRVSRSRGADVAAAVAAARRAQPEWGAMPPVRRGTILHELAIALRAQREEIAYCVDVETRKEMKDALGETDAAVAQGLFMAGEANAFTAAPPPARCRINTRARCASRWAWRGCSSPPTRPSPTSPGKSFPRCFAAKPQY